MTRAFYFTSLHFSLAFLCGRRLACSVWLFSATLFCSFLPSVPIVQKKIAWSSVNLTPPGPPPLWPSPFRFFFSFVILQEEFGGGSNLMFLVFFSSAISWHAPVCPLFCHGRSFDRIFAFLALLFLSHICPARGVTFVGRPSTF